MSEDNKQANGAAAADGLRDVPADIVEYKKFVADGGNEHNDKIRNREEAEKAARAAGVTLSTDELEKIKKAHFAKLRILRNDVRGRDQRIADLERAGAPPNGHPAPAKPDAVTPAPAKPPADAPAPAEDKTPPRPQEKDFKTYSEFVEALTDWKTDRKFDAREAKRAETQQPVAIVAPPEYTARVDEAIKRYDDWDTVFEGLNDDSYTRLTMDYIFESDKGPDITYYLATHRKELARLRELSPIKQAAALGRIEDRLSEDDDKPSDDEEGEDKDKGEDAKPAKAAPAKAKPARPADDEDDEEEDDEDEEKKPAVKQHRSTHSKAPAPAKPLGGRGGSDDSMPDPSNFVEYEKWARRQQAKGKR